MATATAPRARPTNLPEVTEFPNEPPVPLPSDEADAATLAWAEAVRDHFEKDGKLLTVPGLLKVADTAGLSVEDTAGLKKQLRSLYAAEHKSAQGKAPKKEKAVTKTAPPKKPAKKSAPKKVSTKAAAKAKPSPNGHAPAKKRTGGDSKLVFEKTVKGVPVKVFKSDSGRLRVILFDDLPIRKAFGWMGKQGFQIGEARSAAETLLKDYKGGAEYANEVLAEGHVGSGAKAKNGRSVFGDLPKLSQDQARALKALAK